nr:nucleoside-diphosphate-sugar epimerase [Raoultella sp. NCTC 9187]
MGDADDGEPASELNFNPAHPNPRVASELAGNQLLDAGVDVRVVRLPQVHDTVRQGLLTYYIQQAAEKGVAAIVGEGNNCWSAGHINDVARLYLRVLERVRKVGAIMPLTRKRCPQGWLLTWWQKSSAFRLNR